MKALGVIGGSGLYQMAGLMDRREETITTPFGEPSDAYVLGTIAGRPIAFLGRHGRGHRLLPSEINFRANIYGFKSLGVERIVSISAVGSLREDLRPLDVVVPDQFIDLTRHRPSTFFGSGLVAHVSLADPVCPDLSALLFEMAKTGGARAHRGGAYVCIEGPQFSTRAESHLFRSIRADVIGMTNAQEFKLAREAEICYATLAMVTDYDCWRPEEAAVTVEEVIARLNDNAATAQSVVTRTLGRLEDGRSCPCASALKNALLTERSRIPRAVIQRLGPLVAKYLG
jgi:5'-methylthioadenosine phosphorylase